ncbi:MULTISPECIES: TonB-dependent siderophore receptor [unclassified Limnobacter]|jgi:iron complex outermembrane recepter protein|uniref:TonB-dependent receptor n=1 Tax=unclassified Limnobacter TaxID=2630203 RepID=UPI000C52D366|nr:MULTISPECIES: TonB-dependent siderophore receptor [unclassified Limnobacter]MAZ10484.1 TonB-dependent siderophore receptor [Sutterellaceae bacterium]|tara:strand:+ start:356 stop:2470 length:2115 start_codon:yes stop_codon:yes gene_type:complete
MSFKLKTTVLAMSLAGLSSAWAQNNALPEVKVSAETESSSGTVPYAGGQVSRQGTLGVLGTNDVMDIPFSTVNFTSTLLENQQARTLKDVLENDASVRVLTGTGGFGEDFQIRGFNVPSGDVGLNGLYGLVSSSRLPIEILERVELLKGPGALVNGIAPNGSVGGGINVVTKRADDIPLTRLETSIQSEGQVGAHLDIGRRFGENNEWGVRFNGVLRDGEGSIKNGDAALGLAAIGLDYRGRQLRWSLDAFEQREDIEELRPQIGIPATLSAVPAPPPGDLNFYPGNPLELQDTTVASKFEYDINEHVTTYGGLGYRQGDATQVFPVTGGDLDEQGNFTVRGTFFDSYSKTSSMDAGVRLKFNTASVKHTVNVGVSLLEQENGNVFVSGGANVPSNIYNPTPLPPVGQPRRGPAKASESTLFSYVLSDTMAFMDDRLLLTLGARDQTVEQDGFNTTTGAVTSSYNASSISPLVGVVFKATPSTSIYSNYTEGLTRGTIVGPAFANAGEVLAPFKSPQFEIGVKKDWGRITTTAAVFEISRPNLQTNAATNTSNYDGEQRNRGLELGAYGEVFPGLRGMASALFNDAELSSTAGGVNQGNEAPSVPRQTFSLGLDYDLPWLPKASVNGRIINTSEMAVNAANNLSVAGWTRYDIGAQYRTSLGNKPLILRANIENLTDENYWLVSGTFASVAAPRTFIVSASVDF